MKRKGLGRGLEALLKDTHVKPLSETESEVDSVLFLPIKSIELNPNQPRSVFDETQIKALSESIQSQGVLQPLLVRKVGKRFELIAGERRLRASTMVGLSEVPVRVLEAIDDRSSLVIALIENIQRSDLTAIEQSEGIERLRESYSLTHQELSALLGISRVQISNLLRLLKLPVPIKTMLAEQSIEMGHARALLGLSDEADQLLLARLVGSRQLSVREIEDRVRTINQKKGTSKPVSAAKADENHLVRLLEDKMSCSVKVKSDQKGKTSLIFNLKNQAALTQFLLSLGITQSDIDWFS